MPDKIKLMDGLLPINKPTGITSYDVVRQIKKIIPRGTKIGHAGTLDPFADGVLILMLGKATKRFSEIQTWGKTYYAKAKLGASSNTLDCTGAIKKSNIAIPNSLKLKDIQNIASQYIGEIEQVVPSYSASKYKGRKLYEYARKGIAIPQKKKKVVVYSIKVLSISQTEVEMVIECSSGTYIRQLTFDILKELNIESYLTDLTRTAIGEIKLKDCLDIDKLSKPAILDKIMT